MSATNTGRYRGHNASSLESLDLPEDPALCTDQQLEAIWDLMDVPLNYLLYGEQALHTDG